MLGRLRVDGRCQRKLFGLKSAAPVSTAARLWWGGTMGAFEGCRRRGTCRARVQRAKRRTFVRGDFRTTPRINRGTVDVGQERHWYISCCRGQAFREAYQRVL